MSGLRKNLSTFAVLIAVILSTATSVRAFDLRQTIANARDGQTIHVPAGVYNGPLQINRKLKVIADPGAVIDGHETGTIVQILSPDVTLGGFTIRGTGADLEREHAAIWVRADHVTIENTRIEDSLFGISVIQSKRVTLRNNEITGKQLDIARRGDGIRLWYSPDCVLENNRVHDVRDVVIWFSKGTLIHRNTVSHSRYGLHFMFCDDNTLEDNRLEENSVGTYLMNSRNLKLRRNTFASNRGVSGYGIGLKDMDGVEASENRIVGNHIGIYIDSSPNDLSIHNHFVRNLIAYNELGIGLLPAVQNNQFSENTFRENQEQLGVLGSGELVGNDFAINGVGNYWSDYRGFDAKGNGIGDIPYVSQSLFENLMDRQPKLRLFLYSPAQQILELSAQAVPTIKPKAKLTDPAPLMSPRFDPAGETVAGTNWPLIELAAVLAGFSAVVVLAGKLRSQPPTKSLRKTQLTESVMKFDKPILTVSGLCKRFGRFQAIEELSFEVQPGLAFALWGGNGAGKTTIIRCVLGVIRSRGQVDIDGLNIRLRGKLARTRVGYVPQENSFQGDLSVREALRLYAKLKGVSAERASELLVQVQLADHETKRVSQLSGGMRKRLALAAALLNDPPLLVLDELDANLDTEARQSLLALLCDLKKQGKAILFTSHRFDEVDALADQVLVLRSGKCVGIHTPEELAGVVGASCRVKLLLPQDRVATALEILQADGFSARRNGRGVWVGVAHGQKAAPIHSLARRQIVIEDFEIETHEAEGSHEHLN